MLIFLYYFVAVSCCSFILCLPVDPKSTEIVLHSFQHKNICCDPAKCRQSIFLPMPKTNCFKVDKYTSAILAKGNDFCNFLFASLDDAVIQPFQTRSIFKGKSLLLREQILSFKSRPQLRPQAKRKGKHASHESVPIHLWQINKIT